MIATKTEDRTFESSSAMAEESRALRTSERPTNHFINDQEQYKAFRPDRSIRKQEIAEVTAQLSIMTRSGIDLASALESLSHQCQRPRMAEILKDVKDSVLGGSLLSDALRKHPNVFEPTYVATVAAGEASGKMSKVLAQLAEMQRSELRSVRAIRTMLTYPILLTLVSSSVLAGLILFVLPRFMTIFSQYDMPLPLITEVLLGVADLLRNGWWIWLPAMIAGFIGLFLWRTTESGATTIHRFWIYGPVIGTVCRAALVSRACRLLALMLENGVPLLESLQLVRHAMGNRMYKQLFLRLEDAVVNGQGLAAALKKSDILPESAKEMIATAERTGNLHEVTSMIAEYYEEEAQAKTRQLVGMMEPIITVVMGVVVATVVLAVMLPVFDLSKFASGGH